MGISVLGPQSVVTTENATLIASGSLHQALDTQLASDTGAPVRIGITYRNRDGAVCRTFATSTAHIQGLACRSGTQGLLEMVTRDPNTPSGGMRTAATEMDPVILQAVQYSMNGNAFDASAEKRARDLHWVGPRD